MKKHLLTLVLALVVGVLGFAVSGVAIASNGSGGSKGGPNPCPPSQHAVYDQDGNFVSCQDNGNPSGEPGGGVGNCGQNQSGNPGNGGDQGNGRGDSCTETTPTETTPTETTPTESTPTETTPTETTPTESTPTETTPSGPNTPPATTPQETTPEQPSQPPASSPEPQSPPSIVGTPPKAQHNPAKSPAHSAVAGTSAKSAPKPTRKPQPAPFTL